MGPDVSKEEGRTQEILEITRKEGDKVDDPVQDADFSEQCSIICL